jgi:uncharacterized phage-associated protein
METLRDVILHVLRLAGPGGIGRTVLIKIIYFAQLESWRTRGEPLTRVSFYSYKYGAYAPEVVYLAENLPDVEGSRFYHFYAENRYKLEDESVFIGELAPEAKEILERVFEKCGHMTAAAAGQLSKTTEPMQHAEPGVPLDFSVVAPQRSQLRVRNSDLARAQAGLDLSERGTRAELDERDEAELLAWANARRRANAS